MSNNVKNVIGLQIGGQVGPNDSVGMHIAMPTKPGIGVSIDINSAQINQRVSEFLNDIPDNQQYKTVQNVANEVINENDFQLKLRKLETLVSIASGIATLTTSIQPIKQLLGL